MNTISSLVEDYLELFNQPLPELEVIQELMCCPTTNHWQCKKCRRKWKTEEKNLYTMSIRVSNETLCQKLEDFFQEDKEQMGCCENCHIQKMGPEFSCPTLRGDVNGKK